MHRGTFRFNAVLDFGIYPMLDAKPTQMEGFIHTSLPAVADAGLNAGQLMPMYQDIPRSGLYSEGG